MQQDVVFDGLVAPLRLDRAASVLPLISDVIPGWPHQVRAADSAVLPFYSIRDSADDGLLSCTWHVENRPVRQFDPVNAVCDAISALAFALPAEDQRVICLHAAAVEMAGRLVIFPNIRRAGKSTLSAALAMAGHPLFSDDVLPLSFASDKRALGRAMGIAPRLRLPLPDSVPTAFKEWVAAVSGERNRQYLYLSLPKQPKHGDIRPLGAFVILNRQDNAVDARLERVASDVAMDVLLHQNFTRDRHSGDILHLMAATLAELPVFRLTYSGLAEAVACLTTGFAAWPDEMPAEGWGAERPFRLARFDGPDLPPRSHGDPIRQRAGTITEEIGNTLYLADPEGLAIHRMDALASVIWSMLEDAVTPQDILDLLLEAFPETDAAKVATDVRGLLEMLHDARLIETVSRA
jgi:hypothetical protein